MIEKKAIRHSLIWGILVPLLFIGILSSLVLNGILAPSLSKVLKQKIDITVHHATNMAVTVCEERFADLLDLRMESNPEMNTASKKEAIEEIKRISSIFPNIKMVVMNRQGKIFGASIDIPKKPMGPLLDFLEEHSGHKEIFPIELWGEPVIAYSEYFPFWRWVIVSFISEDDYLAPIRTAERIVGFGIFGTLLIVTLAMLFVFIWKVNKPLKEIIRASDHVGRGNLENVIAVDGNNEIARVATAFNDMVRSLAKDREKIDIIMEDVRKSEEKYRVLTENSIAVIAMLQRGRFIYANKAISQILRYKPTELSGIKFIDLADKASSVEIERMFQTLESSESQVENYEACFRTRDAQKVWLEISATILPYHGEDAVLIHGIDITSKKVMSKEHEAMREKLARIEKMEAVGALAGGVAHDLNNILSGIVGYPELLLLEMDENDPSYKPLEAIQKSGQKAAAVVQDLLTLTRRGVVITKVVDLNSIVEDYLLSPEFVTLTNFHSNVHIKTDLAPDLLNIDGSSLHLSKTIMNLVINGIEAMDDGGIVNLITENRYVDRPFGNYDRIEEGEYAVLTVSDTGIVQEDLEKIFEPFYTRKTMGRSGTGLGMSVVWGTVKDHRGYIDIHSIEGRGTTFILYFPATRKKPSELLLSFDIDKYRGDGYSVMVIDDVEEQRLIATAMLEKLGYSVVTAASGEEAINSLSDSHVDILLLDMIMDPGIDGYETYANILEMKRDQKAIIASGYSETDRVRKAQELGAGAYIRKPYVIETLAVTLKEELNS